MTHEKSITCIGCGEVIPPDDPYFDDRQTTPDGEVCYPCWEQAEGYPNATIVTNDPDLVFPDGDCYDDECGRSRGIDHDYSHPSIFRTEYIRTDGWRGYNKVIKPDGWIQLVDDNILALSQDARELKEMHDYLIESLEELQISYAVIYTTSSNVFSQGYDLFIETPANEETTFRLIALTTRLVETYRDPDRYLRTALTGSGENTTEARLITKYYQHLHSGGQKGPAEFLEGEGVL